MSAVAIGESTPMPLGSQTIEADGAFNISGQLLGGEAYTVGWYIDINESHACDTAPNDHVWTEDIPTLTKDETFNVQPNNDFGTCQ